MQQVRAEGDAVQPFDFAGEDAAFQARMNGNDLGLCTVLCLVHSYAAVAQGAFAGVGPSGIVAVEPHAAAQQLGQGLQFAAQQLLRRGHRAAQGEAQDGFAVVQFGNAQIQRGLHKARHIHAHGLHAPGHQQQGLAQAQAGVQQARAQQAASLAQIQASMDQINKQASLGTVTAPCSGTVTAVNVDRGGMASSAQPSVVIAENGAVEVQVSVAEDVFTGIKVGDTASVTVSAVSKESMNGTVSTLPAAANAQTNLYDVSVSLPSGTKPPIGAFATVTFYTDRRASTISVPTESILTGNNNEQYVFTVNADGTAATRVTVTTGLVTKDSTEIVSGLKAGDRVVTKGQSYLSDGAAVHVVTSDAADGGEG